MSNKTHKRGRRWPIVLLTLILLAGAGAAGAWYLGYWPGVSAATDSATSALPTVAIQSLDVAQSAVSASGNWGRCATRRVPLGVGCVVRTVAVGVGEGVHAAQLLGQRGTT